MILYIKVVTLRNVSSEITNFQKDLFFKEYSWRQRFSISLSISSMLVSVISYFHIWKKSKKVFQRRLNSFHNVIFNKWGLLPGSINDFFLRSIACLNLERLFSRSNFYNIACFQSLLVDSIWMLLLLQRMFWEGQMHDWCYCISLWTPYMNSSLALDNFFSRSRIPPIISGLKWLCNVFCNAL